MANNHTQGIYEADLTVSESGPVIGRDGTIMIQIVHDHIGKRKAKQLTDLLVGMLNAADGIPTEQAVKAIENIKDIKETLIGIINKSNANLGTGRKIGRMAEMAGELLAKLED